jgi:sugar lactone lactonase YvrE
VYGLAVDPAGNLYIADGGNHRIRMVDAATHHIRTIAGDGDETASGDGGSALHAGMSPLNLLLQPSGDLVFTDFLNNKVRRISHGVVSTIAGTGDYGFGGDHGPAIAAQLSNPHGLAPGPDGSIYVTDNGNNRVRRIDAAGVITTVAGNGSFTHSGDGGPATAAGLMDPFGLATDSAGRLFIAEPDGVRLVGTGGRIRTIAGDGTADFGGDGGPATSAQLSDPQAVAVSASGQVYIADDVNCRIRRVDERTGTVTTVAGTGTCGYSGDHGPATSAQLDRPQGVALDRAGNLLIADTFNLRVRKVDVRTGIITTVAGTGGPGPAGDGGSATSARLDLPYGIAVSPSGDIAISQWHAGTVRVINHHTGRIQTVAGALGRAAALGDGGAATRASLSFPTSVAYGPGDNLYIADVGHFRIRRVNPRTGVITTVAGTGHKGFSGDGRRATIARISRVGGLAVGSDGTVYLSDVDNHRVRQIHHGVIRTIAGNGSAALSGDGGSARAAGISDPRGLAIDGSGALHICDASSGRVRVIHGLS